MDYLMFRGFDLDKIIDSKAKTKSAKSLKDKIAKSGKPLKSANKATRRKTNVDLDDLSLDLLTQAISGNTTAYITFKNR